MLRVVNFGSSKGGLATVGYTVYGLAGNVIAARSTAGVVEIGTSTGIYSADVAVPDYDAIVLWDTGETSPKYATEDNQHSITAILDTVQPISRIYNSIKNQGEFFAALMNRLGILEKNEGLKKVNDKIDAIANRKQVDVTEIEDAFNRSVKKITLTAIAPEIKLPEIKLPEIPDYSEQIRELKFLVAKIPTVQKDVNIPDYSGQIKQINSMLDSLQKGIGRIPTTQQEYFKNFSEVLSAMKQSNKAIIEKIESKVSGINTRIEAMNKIFSAINSVAQKIQDLGKKLESLDANDKELINAKGIIIDEVNKVNQLVNVEAKQFKTERHNMMLSFGHKR